MTEAATIKRFADRFANLLDGHKEDVAALVEEVKCADLDAPTLKKIVSVMRQDAVKAAEKQALFDQYLFLAGLAPTPAELPAEGEIATARALFADGLTIRAVAERMKVSPAKAHALKVKASAFDVHVHVNVNKPRSNKGPQIVPEAWAFVTAAREATEAEWAAEAARIAAEKEAEKERRRAERERLREENRRIDADPLEIPSFLRRQQEATR